VAFVFTSFMVNFDNPTSNRKPNKSNHMKILVLGATGRTGKLFAQLATSKNHQVTAIIRNKKDTILPKVNYIEGLPTDEQLLTKALQGMDAVVVSLNINRTSDNPFAKVISPLTLISDSVRAVSSAMEKNNVKRIVSVSASGVGDSWNDMFLVVRWLIRYSNIWKAYEDHDRQEKILRQSALDWTIVRPVMLNDKDVDEYTAVIGKPTGGNISRKAVAKFILDALESGTYVRDTVTLSK
jgi:uncharacterized protein YbjT (DUF2867 family)